MDTGVKSPKNIIPIIIGLTNMPNKIPNRIQSLLKGSKAPGLKIDTVKKSNELKVK